MSTELLVQAAALLSAPLAGLSTLLAVRLRRAARSAAARESGLRGRLAELERRCAELADSAVRDPLTGVANLDLLKRTLEREVARCGRRPPTQPQRELAVVLLEVEGFELVTAEQGRGRAQAILRDLAQRLSLEVRRTDTLGRYGGTEFLVLLPDTDRAGAAKVAERLCWTVRRHRLLDWSGTPWSADPAPGSGNGLRATAGIAVLPADGSHPVPLLRAADRALAAAKRVERAELAERGRTRAMSAERHGNLSPCAGPGPIAQAGAARTVAAVTGADEVHA
ncbi:diguanylate cyclase (GGDEF)-like protein [Kitasatospora sp. GAS204A]|uniref:GGDEF domain-containing protein n=1 Tax=unclassified Kitasatospora TaxID=2633591 RepID=UPI0024745B7E|nr:GGDEF domain-containing protein [Kitasatospora sp. GAS204B]MDH6117991.1 diguanylate cyclase (GGDEF)-like protein [Kitasatospora sp. GAS204B]